MERPKRGDYETLSAYEEARAQYVEWALGAGGRFAAQLAEINERLKQLEKPAAPTEPLTVSIDEQIRLHAEKLILERYDGPTQLNVLRKGTRLGASKKEHLELERMDEWIEAVRAAYQMHKLELAALPEDARPGYDWMQGWPKEA